VGLKIDLLIDIHFFSYRFLSRREKKESVKIATNATPASHWSIDRGYHFLSSNYLNFKSVTPANSVHI
jgi:hypothetical protein